MIVKTVSRTEEELEEYDYRDCLEIYIDGKQVFRVLDDEPEDSNLSRSFGDCYKITELMRKAYEAGKNGESIEFE